MFLQFLMVLSSFLAANSSLTVSSPVVGCGRHCANPILWLHLRGLCADTEQEMLRPICWYALLVRFCILSLSALLSCCSCSVCGGQFLCTSVRRPSASGDFAVNQMLAQLDLLRYWFAETARCESGVVAPFYTRCSDYCLSPGTILPRWF